MTHKILILDDEKAELYFASRLIKEQFNESTDSVEIDTADSYEEALNLLTTNGISSYDILFIDINLHTSNKGGIDLVKYIKEKQPNSPPPICGMLTVSVNDEDIKNSVDVGCDFYMEKSEDIDIYIKTIKLIKSYFLDNEPVSRFLLSTYLRYYK